MNHFCVLPLSFPDWNLEMIRSTTQKCHGFTMFFSSSQVKHLPSAEAENHGFSIWPKSWVKLDPTNKKAGKKHTFLQGGRPLPVISVVGEITPPISGWKNPSYPFIYFRPLKGGRFWDLHLERSENETPTWSKSSFFCWHNFKQVIITLPNSILVGGFRPIEKHESNSKSSPIFGVQIQNIWVATT